MHYGCACHVKVVYSLCKSVSYTPALANILLAVPVEETHFRREDSSTSNDPDSYAVAHDNGYIEKRVHPRSGGVLRKNLPKGKKTVIDLPSDNADSGLDSDDEIKSVVKRKLKKSALKQGVSSPLTQSRSLAPVEGTSDPDFKEFTEPDSEANEIATTTLVPPSTQSLAPLDDDVTSPGVLVTGNEADHQQEEILAEKRRLEDQLSAKEQELKSKDDELRAKEQELKVREVEIAGLNKKMKTYENTFEQQETEKESLCQENKKLQKEMDEICKEIDKVKADKEKAEQACGLLVAEVCDLKRAVNKLNQKVELLHDERIKSDAKVELLQKTCNEHQKAEKGRMISDAHYKAKVDEKFRTLEEDRKRRDDKENKDAEERHQEVVRLINELKLAKK